MTSLSDDEVLSFLGPSSPCAQPAECRHFAQMPTVANSLRRQIPKQKRPLAKALRITVVGRIDTASALQLAELLVSEERSVSNRVAQLDNDLILSQRMLEEFVTFLIPLTADVVKSQRLNADAEESQRPMADGVTAIPTAGRDADAAESQRLTADRVTDIINAVFKRVNVKDALAPVYQAVILLYTMAKPFPLYQFWNWPLHEASKGVTICPEHYKAIVPLTVLLCLALASLPEDRVFTTVTRGETVKNDDDPRWLYFLSEAHDDPYIVCTPMSTSLRHEVAEGFASGTKSLLLTVNGFGFKISKYSFFPNEDEVLIPPFSAYDIVSTKRQMSSQGELRLWVTMEPCITRLEPTRRLAQVMRIALLEDLLDKCEARGLQNKAELEPTDIVVELSGRLESLIGRKNFRVETAPPKSQKYRMLQTLCRDSDTLISSMRELQAMMQCSNNPYFVRLLGANAGVVQPCGDRLRTLQSDDDFSWIEVTLFEEYCTSTAEDIRERATLGDALLFLLCVSSALHYLHACRIAHRDVRLCNVFMRDKCFVLSSLSSARVIPQRDLPSLPDSYKEIEFEAPGAFWIGPNTAFALDIFALCTCFAVMVTHATIGRMQACRDETVRILILHGLTELADEIKKIFDGVGVPSAGMLARLAAGGLRRLQHDIVLQTEITATQTKDVTFAPLQQRLQHDIRMRSEAQTYTEANEAALASPQKQMYCRALIYASSGHNSAIVWICDHVARKSDWEYRSQLFQTICQGEASANDVACWLSSLRQTYFFSARRVLCAFMYDAMKAAVSNGMWTLTCKSRLEEVAAMLNIPSDFMSALEQLVPEMLKPSEQKRRIFESLYDTFLEKQSLNFFEKCRIPRL